MRADRLFVAIGLLVLTGGCGRVGFDALQDGGPPDGGTPLDPTLLAWFTCDDDLATGIVVDRTGHGHDASCTPGVSCPTTTAGVLGAACLFDGSSQHLEVVGAPAFATPPFTVAVFAKRPPARGQSIVAKPYGSGTTDSWQIEFHNSACLNTELSFTGASTASCFSVADVAANTWVHLAVSYDGTARRAYVNGQERLNVADSTISFDSSSIYLGADNNSGSLAEHYAGPLDEIRIYGRVLSPTEIAALASQ